MSRSETLATLRKVLVGKNTPELPTNIPKMPRFKAPAETFSKQLKKVGGIVLDSRTMGLEKCLSTILGKAQSEIFVWEGQDTLEAHSIPFSISRAAKKQKQQFILSNHPQGHVIFPLRLSTVELTLERLENTTISAGSADVAIAETGTILFRTGLNRSRLLFGLPPCRLTLVSRRSIVHNLSQAINAGLQLEESSLITLTTGPSRTADIEKRLVVGVHGPGRWFVILTD